MKLSTKGRYSSRAMLDLALNYGQGPISIKDIARRQEISERYLENIMIALISSGLVISTRGKGGGFMLTKPPHQIRLIEVIHVMEGSLAPVHCVDDPTKCRRSEQCVTFDVWGMMKKAMTDLLDSITLEDMVNMYKEKTSELEEIMYYI
jgi:Rrf2 family protein